MHRSNGVTSMPSLGIEAANSPPTVAAPRRFAAFISYSHDDERVARWLQGKLETYRLPRGLRASVAERADQHRGKGGDRLGAIFRDREDFAAASSLSDAIRQALADSQALIVLCSPTARASVWVNAEIALFRELHPDRPILAAIVATWVMTLEMVRIDSAVSSATRCTSATWAAISSVALLLCPARVLTSEATTAKPLPASPARAASMVALRASRLVCSAIWRMRVTALPI